MEYLERIAAQEFLDLCRISYFEGIIGRYEFMSRMRAVLSLAEPNSGVFRYAKKLIEQENWEAECKWDRWRQGDGRGFEGDDIRSQEADDQSSFFTLCQNPQWASLGNGSFIKETLIPTLLSLMGTIIMTTDGSSMRTGGLFIFRANRMEESLVTPSFDFGITPDFAYLPMRQSNTL